jgi:Mg2+ and Co2+ transporter CorA
MDSRLMEKRLKNEIEEFEELIFSGEQINLMRFYALKKRLIKHGYKDLLEIHLILEAMLEKQHNDTMNKRLNILTIWSTIFLPLSFYTGLFGMNFDDVPFLNNHHGFWIFTLLTIGTIFIMFLYFKLKKWF